MFFYYIALSMTTLLAMNSTSWFTIWILMEINLMVFIPLILMSPMMNLSEASIKYFIPQTLGSLLILFSIFLSKFNSLNPSPTLFIFSMGLALKLALAPLHMWILNLLEKIKFNIMILLMTWQKLIPLSLLKISNNFFILIFTFSSILLSSVFALYQSSTRKILAYSSILNTSWMIIMFNLNKPLSLTFFFLYSLTTILTIMLLKKENLINMISLLLKPLNTSIKMLLMMLTMAGLPPSTGFILKLLILKTLILKNANFLILILIISSLISFYFYSRMFFSFISLTPLIKLIYTKISTNKLTPLPFLFFFIPFIVLLK